jgi:hypothetical protein
VKTESIAKVQKDIRILSKTIHDLSIKYEEDPKIKTLQSEFLKLSVDVRKALKIPLH